MLISDKQELRKCVKRAVRRAQIAEAALCCAAQTSETRLDALILSAKPAGMLVGDTAKLPGNQLGTPLGSDAAAMFAAIDAMGFDTANLERSREQAQAYTDEAYHRHILDMLKASTVFVHMPSDVMSDQMQDERMCPVLTVDNALFEPGRYGVDYRQAAMTLADALSERGAKHVSLEVYDAQAVRYALIPLAQDTRCTLHLHIPGAGELTEFAAMLDEAQGVRAVVSTQGAAHTRLIELARTRLRMLPVLTDTAYLGAALSALGTRRFAAYSSRAKLPEMMLGRWALAKSEISEALCQAYLPLARAGYPLQSEAVEMDVACLMGINMTLFAGGAPHDQHVETGACF